MAVDIYLDPATNDIDLTNNTMRLTEDIQESSRQQVWIVLSAYKGEWVYNTNFGIPYLANDNNNIQLLGKSTSTQLLDTKIKQATRDRENIVGISSYESTQEAGAREVNVSISAVTKTGEVVSVVNTIT